MLKAFFKTMDVIDKHLETLRQVEDNIEDYAKKIVLENSDEIISILQDKQLGEGQYWTGRPLKWQSGTGYYAKSTAYLSASAIKPKIAGDPYNFEWSGSTFASMVLKTENTKTYSIFSRDGKMEFLKKTYGDKLFKLSNENNKWVNENIIEPKLAKFIEDNWWQIGI